jgi:DUF4097 and DUF4098 domain-containing protein YvlB
MPRPPLLLVLGLTVALAATARTRRLEEELGPPLASGSFVLRNSDRLRVICACTAVVRGSDRSEVGYQVKIRGRRARRHTPRVPVTARSSGGWTVLHVTAPQDTLSYEVHVEAPRGLREVRVESHGGGVQAYDLNGQLRAQATWGPIRLDRVWGGAVARTGGGDIEIGMAKGLLQCASGGGSIRIGKAFGDATIDTAGGEIAVGEVTGVLNAATAGGCIRVVHATSAVIARTAGGQIEVDQAAALVTASTNGGAIQVGAARGVRLDSGSGAIRVRNVTGPVRISTTYGSILADLLANRPLENSSLSTGKGDVTVFIPSNLAVTIRALTEWGGRGGRILSDFPEVRIRGAEPSSGRPATAEGALNGGGPLLNVSAAGGSIYLRRQR